MRRTERRELRRAAMDGRPVLLDVLISPGPGDIDALAYEYDLLRELTALPAVLGVLAMTSYEGQPALVFEDFDGLPLETHACMAPAEFLRIGERIAEALAEVHRDNIVHRDLRPGNILVDSARSEVKITGFGLASRLPCEVSDVQSGQLVEASLPYVSPEQTGRMNRAVDTRSDLYALGVVFFEMLTARRPFEGRDVLEWFHCHVARPAPSPRAFVPAVPEQLAAIIQKLLSKRAEDRYQTASGLGEDLARCRAELLEVGRIEPFPLAVHDIPDTLQLTQKLYGREADLAVLEQAFNRVAEGMRPELVLVSGYAGVGKSVLVQELLRSAAEVKASFLVGKFEQYGGNLPGLPMAAAFRPVVRDLLGKGEAELASWRKRLHDALGPNARLVADLVPELGILLGSQPEVPSLGPLEDEQRFHVVVARFIGALVSDVRPMVLFLDDLQWADQATLRLLEHIITELGEAPFLVIGAFRDNELVPSHPLHGAIDRLHASGHLVDHVHVKPLSLEELTALVVDTLRRPVEDVRSLAELLFAKTGGNPFFATQFLRELFRRRMLFFDHAEHRWRWNEERIAREGYTDNVVDLMIGRIRELPSRTLEILELAAIVGSAISERMLVRISEWSPDAVHHDLFAALQEGLLVRAGGGGYRFAHDRVQQAAYSLIPESDRPRYHARVGRLLLAGTPEPERSEHLFEITSQLNAARALLTPEERDRLAELNLHAGRRAKAAAAYVAAASHLATGVSLLRADAWDGPRASLAFELHLEQARCELLAGDAVTARRLLAVLARPTLTKRQLADLALVEILTHVVQGDNTGAVEIGLDCLRRFGIDWSSDPDRREVEVAYERLMQSLAGREIEALVDLPRMTDPDAAAVLEVLCAMKAPVLLSSVNLFSLLAIQMASTSITFGNTGSSGFGYLTLAMALVQRFDRLDEARRFGELGHAVAERLASPAERGRAYLDFALVSSWSRPLRDAQVLFDEAIALCRQSADVPHACYAYACLVVLLHVRGAPLAETLRVVEEALQYARRSKYRLIELLLMSQGQMILHAQGRTASFATLDDSGFDEAAHERELAVDRKSFQFAVCWHYVSKLFARYLAGKYDDALAAAQRAKETLWSSAALLQVAAYRFHHALTRAALWDRAPADERPTHLAELRAETERYRVWAEHCPENFRHRHALLDAEIARIVGDELAAETGYELAIQAAREQDFVADVALGFELAGRYWLGRGFQRIGQTYLRDARDEYLRWGADGKVAQLEALHPWLGERHEPARARALVAGAEQLDLLSVTKASLSIAEETELEDLIRTLMRVVLEQSVAERGYLLLASDAGPLIRAEACSTDRGIEAALLSGPLEGSHLVPEPLVNYVWRSRMQVILTDASDRQRRGTLIPAEYLARVRPKSVLCHPIVRRGQVVGALYLENNLVTHAFTPERVAALEPIAAQAAISLEITSVLQQARSARDALERSEARFRRVYESNMIGIAYGDMDGRIIDANDYVLDKLQYTRADLDAGLLRWFDVTASEHSEADAKAVLELRASRVCHTFAREYVRKDGARIPVLVGASLLEGSVDEVVVFILDVTERQRLLLQERQARAAAEEAVRAREDFMAIAAHELRTPLTPLKLQLQMLQRVLAEEPAAAGASKNLLRLFLSADRQVDRLTRLVGDLLDLSRLGREKLILELETLDLADLVREVVERHRSDWTRAGCAVTVHCDASVPGRFDRHRIEQVVVNLLANAIKYGSSQPIDITLRAERGHAILTMRDRGIGISEEDQARIFERFARAVSVKHFGGFGLGLYICREIVHAHGGSIGVQSHLGAGATFSVTLPLEPVRSALETAADVTGLSPRAS